MNLDRVRSYLKCITYRRRFLAERERSRQAKMEQGDGFFRFQSTRYDRPHPAVHPDIPAIIVDDFPTTPPQSTRDITSYPASPFSDAESPGRSPGEATRDPFELSFGGGSPHSSALHRARRTSDVSMLSTDLGLRYASVASSRRFTCTSDALCRRDLSPSRDSSLIPDDDGQDVLAAVQNSSWGGKCCRRHALCLFLTVRFFADLMLEAEEEEHRQ